MPKLQPSASILKFQLSSQLRSSSQPFLRQLTLSSPSIESPAQVSVHDISSPTSSQPTIISSLHEPISPPTTSNSFRPSSSEFSPLLSPLNAPVSHPRPTPTISQVCDFIPQSPSPKLTKSSRSSKSSTRPVYSPAGPSFPQPNPISSPITLTPLPLDFRRCFVAPRSPKITTRKLTSLNNLLRRR